jgi:hypothetical protein
MDELSYMFLSAQVDQATDALIQKMLRTKFGKATVTLIILITLIITLVIITTRMTQIIRTRC